MTTLSSILGQSLRFSSFNELIAISNVSYSSQHDLFKINKTIESIIEYLDSILRSFELACKEQYLNDLNWIYEGKEELIEIIRNLESIDGILSQLLTVLDDYNGDHTKLHKLLDRFELASNVLLDVKKYTIIFKKRLYAANHIKDIESVISSIVREMEVCLEELIQLEKDVTDENEEETDLELKSLVNKLKNNFGILRNNKLNNKWTELQTKVKPLDASLQFLPLRIEELDSINSTFNDKTLLVKPRQKLENSYKDLIRKWTTLQLHLENIKDQIFKLKWHKIFTFLVQDATLLCKELFLQVKNNTYNDVNDDSKDFGEQYKLCFNAIQIINRAFAEENILNDIELILSFNEQLLPQWHLLNDEISNMSESILSSPSIPSSDLKNMKPYRIISQGKPMNEAETEIHQSEDGQHTGITFSLQIKNIDSNKVPFSAQPKDKIKDFFIDGKPKKARDSLILDLITAEDESDNESSFLLNNKNNRSSSIEVKELTKNFSKLKVEDYLQHQEIWNYLRNHNNKIPSRIPIIIPFYINEGYPKIAKRSEISKIPIISPDHPIFKSVKTSNKGLKPPVFIASQSMLEHSAEKFSPKSETFDLNNVSTTTNDKLDELFRKPSRKPSVIETVPKNTIRNSLAQSPRISYSSPQRSPHWRSTSPERPLSSLGSRFDDSHLFQPFKSPKTISN